MSSRTRWSIVAFALLGLGFALASSWVHYRVLTDPTYVSPCDINASFNCTQVYMSRYGSVMGVPVAIAGVMWFGLVALIAGFARPTDGPSVAAGYLFGVATVGLAVVIYLAYASFVVLGTGCLLCIGTYVAVAAIFVLASLTKSVPVTGLPGRMSGDLRTLGGRPIALVAALLYLAATVGAVAMFPRDEDAAAAAASQAASAPAPSDDIQRNFETAWNQQPRVELGIPAEGAKVIIVKFNDYECPACRQAELLYRPVVEKFAASHPGLVKYVVKDWPWDSSCNFNSASTIRGHEAACDAAAAARMAKDRGKFPEMEAWLYANQGTTKAELREAARTILGVNDFDREYALKVADVRRDIADGGVLQINSTPTFFINGVRLPADSTMPPQYFELAINLELKRAG